MRLIIVSAISLLSASLLFDYAAAADCRYMKTLVGSTVCIEKPATLRRGSLPENRRLELVPTTTRTFKPAKHIWKRVVDTRTSRQRKAAAQASFEENRDLRDHSFPTVTY